MHPHLGFRMEDRRRVIIEAVSPAIDDGRFPIKRTLGESVCVEADVFIDGHDQVGAVLLTRHTGQTNWSESLMEPQANDRWRGEFRVTELGRYFYSVRGWLDAFSTWRAALAKKLAAGQQERVDLLVGALLVDAAAKRACERDAKALAHWAEQMRQFDDAAWGLAAAEGDELARFMARYPDLRYATQYQRDLVVVVERDKARFSTWYELFPRSCGAAGAHGTLADCAARLSYIASMGFDTVYLPPLHPIGRSFRKGKNNTLASTPGDPGSPWAIGAAEGGHKAIHPELGTLEDFDRLLVRAREFGIEIALDLAYQCSPDHPYVSAHPEWFGRRPDGTIQYAENPPKKYQDIYPFNFESENWRELWQELESIARFWLERGVRIFRVDNPHTKPFAFWEHLIAALQQDYPDAIFLAEAFTRPKVMRRLAKLGFSQSYTYFTWRNTSAELTEYFTGLTRSDAREYFRPNLWPNTPDILPEYLQFGGRPAFMTRLVLAATLGANYGIYGPAFELCEARPREPGSEEYLDSEKYQLRHWDLSSPGSLKDFVARINRIRRENSALHHDRSLRFHPTDNDQLLCYSKVSADSANIIIVAVNLDPHHKQSGWARPNISDMGLDVTSGYQLHDLINDSRFFWHGSRLYLELDPEIVPAHVFRLRRHVRREQQFDYFM
jgi:starch synthase (maltosyl-transferring)